MPPNCPSLSLLHSQLVGDVFGTVNESLSLDSFRSRNRPFVDDAEVQWSMETLRNTRAIAEVSTVNRGSSTGYEEETVSWEWMELTRVMLVAALL